MKNKVLVKLYIPELSEMFDVFLPVNEFMWKIKKIIVKSVSDLSNYPLDIDGKYILVNDENGTIYDDNEILLNTDIRNTTKLLLITV